MKLAARTAAHRKAEQDKRARKVLRRQRAAIHAAMTEAARMKRSRKKGTRDVIANVAALGFDYHGGMPEHGLGGGGDVVAKFKAAAAAVAA